MSAPDSRLDLSVAITHDRRRPDRVRCLEEMLQELGPPGVMPGGASLQRVFDRERQPDESFHDFKVGLFEDQWSWALSTGARHHLFMTDDLHLAPRFLECLASMLRAVPAQVVGLLSNHPDAPRAWGDGHRWYRTRSWVVGPAYVVPHAMLQVFFAWWRALPDDWGKQTIGTRQWFNDDSALNHWIVLGGGPGEAWHPLPTIIEHRADLPSTLGHGDRTSRERVSWREVRRVVEGPDDSFAWESRPHEGGDPSWHVDGHPPVLALRDR